MAAAVEQKIAPPPVGGAVGPLPADGRICYDEGIRDDVRDYIATTANDGSDSNSDDELGAWMWKSSRTVRAVAAAKDAAAAVDGDAKSGPPAQGSGPEAGATVSAAAGSRGERAVEEGRAGAGGDVPAGVAGAVAMATRPCSFKSSGELTIDALLRAAVALEPLPPPSAASDGADASAGAEPEPRANEGPVANGTAAPSAAPTSNKGIRLLDRPDPSRQSRPRWKRKVCREEDCTNSVVRGGVCIKHGAKAKRCSHDGCTQNAQIGGICIKHGAKVKQCSHDGCTNGGVKGGVCVKHGANRVKRKLCSEKACTNLAQRGGVCIKHGAKVKRCSHDSCANGALKGGFCRTHGAKVKQCSRDSCTKGAKKEGLCAVCWRHQAKLTAKTSERGIVCGTPR